jgi:segregation and condensation protein B
MSLKTKLEAVIYAAEEPVTLAQLAVLFADEALAWKAEQETAAAEALAEDEGTEVVASSEAIGVEDVTAEEVAGEANTVDAGSDAAEAIAASATETVEETDGVEQVQKQEVSEQEVQNESSEAVQQDEASEEAATTGDAAVENAQPEETEEAREKRLARQRDREVKALLRQVLDELVADYATDARGIEIREIAGGFRMATKPECHDAVRGFVKSLKPAMKLSLPALETLAVIAYKQPVTAPEVNEIRGVDASGVFGSLLARKLIATAGRKQVIGRPILYKTTKEFLLRFGLKDVSELPSMEEFEKMASLELEEPEETAAAEATPVESQLAENANEEAAGPEPEATPAAQSGEESSVTPTPEAPETEPEAAE